MLYWLIVLNGLIASYYAVVLPIYTIVIIAALWSSARHRRSLRGRILQLFRKSSLTPPVSILVPAYNEQLSISESVRSLLQLDYPEFEVIVINDGSKDGTLDVLRRDFELITTHLACRPQAPSAAIRNIYISSRDPRLLVIDKANGGKSDAMNAGLNFASSPYFCAVDADVVLEADALLRVMAPMLDARSLVLAAGGIVRVANGSKIEGGRVVEVHLPRRPIDVLQVIEYLRGFLLGREGWSALNSLLIISGAFGVFSRGVALEIGGYRRDTVGEDMDLVVRMHRHLCDSGRPYRILFVPDPVCWTEVPSDLRTLWRQRARWQKGLLDVVWQNRRMFFNPTYGRPGLIAFPYQALVELFGPVVEAAGILCMLGSGLVGLFAWKQIVEIFLFAYALGTVFSVAGVLVEELTYRRYARLREVFRLLVYTLFDCFPYRQFLMVCRIWGMLDYLRRPRQWGAQRRTGFAGAAIVREH